MYNVKLEIFEGPLDLLLYLIRKNDVDIYDIPISVVTEQYIEYIEMIKKMNLDLAGEFLIMAATLMQIKSKMLLPIREEASEDLDEGLDPREELVRKLIEYKRYKDISFELKERRLLGRDVFKRGAPYNLDDIGITEEEEQQATQDLSLTELLEAFQDVLKRMPKNYQLDLTVDKFKVADKVSHIMDYLSSKDSVLFTELFEGTLERGEVVVTFLAILELAKLKLMKISQAEDKTIRLFKATEVYEGDRARPEDLEGNVEIEEYS